MLNAILNGILIRIWNWSLKYQGDIIYTELETNNDHSFKKTFGKVNYVFEVKQIVLIRKPQRLFLDRKVRQYKVVAVVFNGNKYSHTVIRYMPEFSGWVYRNTKIPHVLAVNAFSKILENQSKNESKNYRE